MATELFILLAVAIAALVLVVIMQQRQIQRIVMLALEDHRRRSEGPRVTQNPSTSTTGAVRLVPDSDDVSAGNRRTRD